MEQLQTTKSEACSTRATYQDVLEAPPHYVAEIVDGKLYTHPRPAPLHALAVGRLLTIIMSSFHFGRGGPGGWWILREPEIHLGEDVVVPNITGWRRKRMPRLPTGAYCTLAPDWVCEALSSLTRKLDLGGKSAVYAREGVAYHWFVDSDAQSLAAFELRDSQWELIDALYNDATVSLPPFEAISFNLAELWPPNSIHREIPDMLNIKPASISIDSVN